VTRKSVGVNASYFHADTLLSSIRRLSAMGMRRIELPGRATIDLSADDFELLRGVFQSEGLVCTSINAVSDLIPVNFGNLCAVQEKERRNAIDHMKKCVDIAHELGCHKVICDVGTTTEDLLPMDRQNELFLGAITEVLGYASKASVYVSLSIVPGRRWRAWDGYPPDKARVVERYVWPWHEWADEESLIAAMAASLGKQVNWAFDTAHAMVAAGTNKRSLVEAVTPYLNNGLSIVHLANHPGPYNVCWHRLLMHRSLQDGFYNQSDFSALLEHLSRNKFIGDVILNILEPEPLEESLRHSLAFECFTS